MRRPSLFQKDQKLWALGWNIKDFGFFKYILYFQTRFIVAGSFNNERGFYSLVLVHHEHPCPVLDFRGWMKDSRKQMGSTWTRSAQPASQPARLPFGQQNCPVMDSCAQGGAYRKGNHTQYLWAPQGLETHWPDHPTAADRERESFSQGHPPSITQL